jgi:carbon-monoxide dehydrogenase medium subunit
LPGLDLARPRQRRGVRDVSGFEYHQPASVGDAVALAARFREEGRFLAGGTDLLVQIRRGALAPRHVIGLQAVAGLRGLHVNGGVRLGASVTHRTIERTPALLGPWRCLVEGAEVIGGHQVRNVATVAGNLVNASPAADLNACLLALNGTVTLVGEGGSRSVAVERFLLGPHRTDRRPEELLTEVSLPALPARSATAFLKAGRRKAMEISVVCVAVRLTLDESGRRCAEAGIALGAVAPTTIRAREAERLLTGELAGADAFRAAAEACQRACQPIDDVRATARFRRHLVGVLVRRALERAAARAAA